MSSAPLERWEKHGRRVTWNARPLGRQASLPFVQENWASDRSCGGIPQLGVGANQWVQMVSGGGPRGCPGSLLATQSALSILGMRRSASRPYWAAASPPQHQEFRTRHRGDGLSPQRLEAATRVPWGHLQTQTQESLEGSEAPTWLLHYKGLRKLQSTFGKFCASCQCLLICSHQSQKGHRYFWSVIYFYVLIYLFLASLGLLCSRRAFSSFSKQGLLFIAMCGLLLTVASLVAQRRLSSYGSQACGIFPDQGLNPFPTLAHWFLTTRPPGRSTDLSNASCLCHFLPLHSLERSEPPPTIVQWHTLAWCPRLERGCVQYLPP